MAPFLETPDGRPRPLTIYVRFRRAVPPQDREVILSALCDDIRTGAIGNPRHHRLSLLAKVDKGSRGVAEAGQAMDLARRAGVRRVALEGTVRAISEEAVSMPGLLQYFNPDQVRRLYETARVADVELVPKNMVDTESVARQAWAGLLVARNMGLELGKYGLFPLTFDESEQVVRRVQEWFRG